MHRKKRLKAGPSDSRETVSILTGIERAVMENQVTEDLVSRLHNEIVWKNLPPRQQMNWARWAWIAGEVDLALMVLAWVNRVKPGLAEAWQARIQLLELLARSDERSATVNEAKKRLNSLQWDRLGLSEAEDSPCPAESTEEDRTAQPFHSYHEGQNQLRLFGDLFSGRLDCYARQWVRRSEGRAGFIMVSAPLTLKEIQAHFEGRNTYGFYPLLPDSTVRVGILTAELKPDYRGRRWNRDERRLIGREEKHVMSRVVEVTSRRVSKPLVECFEPNGIHFWYFSKEPLPAAWVRSLLGPIAKVVNSELTAFSLDHFPKRHRLTGNGPGHLFRLPLGLDQLTGKPSFFVDCRDRSLKAQLGFLNTISRFTM